MAKENLRGQDYWIEIDGKARLVTVVTHIRNDRWMVEGRALPKRFTRWCGRRRTIVHRDEMTWVAAPAEKGAK